MRMPELETIRDVGTAVVIAWSGLLQWVLKRMATDMKDIESRQMERIKSLETDYDILHDRIDKRPTSEEVIRMEDRIHTELLRLSDKLDKLILNKKDCI